MAKLYYLAVIPLLYLGATYLLHVFYFGGTFCESRASLVGKTVIVTGANTGIGKTTSLDMAARGARVILACRSEKRALPVVKEIVEKTKNSRVFFMELDLASFSSVQKFTDAFLRNEERLDILINNAGMISDSDDPKLIENGIEMTMMINHLGHFFLTQNLLGLLKKSGPGSRIINVSSGAAELANPTAFKDLDQLLVDGAQGFPEDLEDVTEPGPQTPNFILDYLIPQFVLEAMVESFMKPKMIRYSNSKLANVLFTHELAKRLKGSGVTTFSLHPGVIRTEIGFNRETGESIPGLLALYDKFPSALNPIKFMFKTLVGGAQTTICCAVSEDLGEAQSGSFYADCQPVPVRREELNGDFPAKFYDWSQSVVDDALGS